MADVSFPCSFSAGIMKILIVEDERAIAERIQTGFERHGYSTTRVTTCAAAINSVIVDEFDCIVLDRRLPDGDGLSVCRQLREEGRSTPILILSAMSHVDDRVEGLELGADDYLIKPFAMDELLARVQALIRRNSIQNTPNLQIGTIELNTLDRTVTVAGKTVALSNKEFALLEYLMRHAGRALDRYQILEHVWGDTTMDETNVVDVYITYLRRKIDQPGLDSPIKTIRGFGYTFQKKD